MHKDITAEDIQEVLEQWDMIQRPYAVYCNPSVTEMIERELGDRYLVISSPAVKDNQIIMIERKKLDEWTQGMFKKRYRSGKDFKDGIIDRPYL